MWTYNRYVTSDSPWRHRPFEFELANGFPRLIVASVAPEGVKPGLIVSLDQSRFEVPGKSKVRVKGVIRADPAVFPPYPNRGFRPRKTEFHLAAYSSGGDYRYPMGGVTVPTFLTRTINTKPSVEVLPNGTFLVSGRTDPPVAGQNIEIEIAYPSGRVDYVTIKTGPNGEYAANVTPAEPGAAMQDRVRQIPRHPARQRRRRRSAARGVLPAREG
jgi:hypothetical protein